MNLHREAEKRSLALHRQVANHLCENPQLLEPIRQHVQQWLATGEVARPYAQAWDAILQLPLAELLQAIVDPNERACALRQSSPFAGILTPRIRWQILQNLSQPQTR